MKDSNLVERDVVEVEIKIRLSDGNRRRKTHFFLSERTKDKGPEYGEVFS